MSKQCSRSIIAVAVVTLVLLAAALLILPLLGRDETPVARSYEDLVWLRKEAVTVTATGAAGAATGSASTGRDVTGQVYAVYIDYTAGITTTTDLTFSQASPALTVMTISNSASDGWYYPAVQQTSSSGAGTSTYKPAVTADAIDIAAAETTSGTVATVTILWGQ